MPDLSRWFVSTEWLADHLADTDVVIVDGSWHLPTTGRSGEAEYRVAHIPGAVFLDIDRVADTTNPLPHMLPSPDEFAESVGANGFAPTDIAVHPGTGDLYISVGGRGTRGAVYRIRYAGGDVPVSIAEVERARLAVQPRSLEWHAGLKAELLESSNAGTDPARLRARQRVAPAPGPACGASRYTPSCPHPTTH